MFKSKRECKRVGCRGEGEGEVGWVVSFLIEEEEEEEEGVVEGVADGADAKTMYDSILSMKSAICETKKKIERERER